MTDSNLTFPDLPAAEIAKVLSGEDIAGVSPADLAKPTPELLFVVFYNLFKYLDPLRNDSDSQIAFGTLELLENPDNHIEAIKIQSLYLKIKGFFASIKYNAFTLRDLIRPEPKRTMRHLSCLVNYIYYRNDKLLQLQPLLDEVPNYEGRKNELLSRISELETDISNREMEARMEEPVVKQIESEVKGFENSIQNLNKQQHLLKKQANDLKDQMDLINTKIAKADFELMNQAQENSKLSSQIVQSPEKHQKALEDKKLMRAEVKNAEKLIMQQIQKKTSDLETCTKAREKISKHLNKMQALQEQANKNKALEKEVKGLKSQLSDAEMTLISLESKIVEKQGKEKQAKEALKAAEKERDIEIEEDNKKLNNLKSEIQFKLNCFEPRERNIEEMFSKGKKLQEETQAMRLDQIAREKQLIAQNNIISKAAEYYVVNNVELSNKKSEDLDAQLK